MTFKVVLAKPAKERLEKHVPRPLLRDLARHLATLGEDPQLGRRPPPGPLEDLGMVYTFVLEAQPLAMTVTAFYRFDSGEDAIEIGDVQIGRLT